MRKNISNPIKTNLTKACAHFMQGELAQANAYCRKVLTHNNKEGEAWHLLAIIEAHKAQYPTALTYIKRAIEYLEPRSALYNTLGTIYKHLNQPAKAHSAYEQALACEPDSISTLINLGNLYHQSDNFQRAQHYYEKALSLSKPSALLYYNLGLVCWKQAKHAAAEAALKQSLSLDPQQAQAHYILALYYAAHNQHKRAIAHGLACLDIEPDHAACQSQLGAWYLKEGNLICALGLLKRAELNPTLPEVMRSEVFYNLGVVYMNQERTSEAIETFQKVLHLDAGYLDARLNLASIYIKQYDKAQAKTQYEQILALHPDHAEAQYMLAALDPSIPAPTHAPNHYIERLFDAYAPTFDSQLTGYLNYQVPQQINALAQLRYSDNAKLTILDLGCGSGLCGPLFRPLAQTLIGVDLSQNMLTVAQHKGCYDVLEKAEIHEYLSQSSQLFDLIIASDVLGYVGDLTRLFGLVSERLKPKGAFLFSVEKSTCFSKAGYELQDCARFAYHHTYLRTLVEQHGFRLDTLNNARLREQHAKPVEGYVVEITHCSSSGQKKKQAVL